MIQMNMWTWLLVLGFLVGLPSAVLLNRGEQCNLRNSEHVWHDNNNEARCCQNIQCQKGEQAVICSKKDPSSTKCERCPLNTYMEHTTDSFDGISCPHMNHCEKHGFTLNREGTTSRDRQCICDVTKGFYTPQGVSHINPENCNFKKCTDGLQLNITGHCNRVTSVDRSTTQARGMSSKRMTLPMVQTIKEVKTILATTTDSVLQTKNRDDNSSNGSIVSVIIPVLIALIAILIVLFIVLLWLSKKKKIGQSNGDKSQDTKRGRSDTKIYNISAGNVLLSESGLNTVNSNSAEPEDPLIIRTTDPLTTT